MRILYIVTAFPRYEGDVITPWLTETILRLKAQGIDVDVFTSSYKGLRDQEIYSIDVKRFRYFFKKWENLTHEETTPDRLKKSIFYKLLILFYLSGGIIGIVRLCFREKYDIIHVHWPFPHMIFGYIGKKVCRAKIVSTFHGVGLRWVESKMPFFKPFLRWTMIKSDYITANSTYTAKDIGKITDRNVAIIPFGVGIEIEESSFEYNEQKNILFVGRLVERKGVRYLIEAFNTISKKIDTKLIIVGEGSERENLEKLVNEKGLREKVNFTGKTSNEKLDEYYRDCAVFVLPACIDSKGDTEGLGVVLIEAMSYKKPVIATNVGGIVDIVKDRETGLLVPEKDTTKLADAICEILNNKTMAVELGKAGYRFVKANFSWEKIIDKLVGTYNELI